MLGIFFVKNINSCNYVLKLVLGFFAAILVINTVPSIFKIA